MEPDNPINEILSRRQALSDSLAEIRLFVDLNVVTVTQDIDDIFNSAALNLDEIIRNASVLQTVGEDQINQIGGLQVLLGEANDRNQELRHELNNSRANVLRTRRMLEDALDDERDVRRYWHGIAEERQGRIGELLREKFAFWLIVQRKDNQIAEHRRNAHRLMLRYNADTER
jgi:hypothetical protein